MDQEQLRNLEAQCIQEHAPPCSAACPLHVDVRGVLAALARDDFDAALQLLAKRLPFPAIIGRVCEQPCRAVCHRHDLGGSLAIADLERACADFGALKPPTRIPRRGKHIAVIGGGLSGITAAFDLTRKGYGVTLFEATDRVGGRLWETDETTLPRDLLTSELDAALQGVEIQLNTPVDAAALPTLRADFDAVYLGVGTGPQTVFATELAQSADPTTFATMQDGVFAGGRAIHRRDAEDAESFATPNSQLLTRNSQLATPFILSVSTGRRAALSIDRFLQKASLTAARVNEGAYTTRLYTALEGVAPVPLIPMATPEQGYTRAEAAAEAARCLQCECMECVKVCAYLEHYGSYPKQYVRQIYNNLSIVMGERRFNTLINSCSLCGLCGAVCPEGLDMAPVCREARQTMVQQNRMPPSAHDFALRDMAFSNGPLATLARHAPGADRSDYVFFPGCQLSASAPEHVEKVYAHLRDRLPNVGLMLRCCGAPADWAGRTDLFAAALADFRADYERLGRPKVILACSTCYQRLKQHLPDVEIVSLWNLLDDIGLPDTARQVPAAPLALHDPCTTRYESAIQDSARNVLATLGCPIEELPLSREKTECCSYGGLMWLANRELAQTVVQRRITEQPLDYVTYCAMCRDFFADQGKPTLHLLDLLYESDLTARAARPGPRFSQRHDNRAQLKRHMLAALWEETVSEPQSMPLQLSEEVAARVDGRLILEDDIRQVIAYAERTGNRFCNPKTGHYLAYYKPANVTYWVEYTPAEAGFTVHNAYSHRMEIVMQPRE
ncbi:MAG TPA: 4Fe-4S dicluster domain-containing protein [Anaerolineae bacterium]|nr:4Fe-4S dicluster domain-containing protein [Anaerolineae bacterium]